MNLASIHSLARICGTDQLLVGNRSKWLYILSSSGKLVRAIECDSDVTHAAPSAHGDFIYATTVKKSLQCFEARTGTLLASLVIEAAGETVGLLVHPFCNYLAIWNDCGAYTLWK